MPNRPQIQQCQQDRQIDEAQPPRATASPRNPITGEKPVECPYCHKHFKTDHDLSRHRAAKTH